MTSKEEQKNKKIGVLTSVGFHLVLLVLFMFLLAWSEPDPPIPEYGIELSFIQSDLTGPERTEQQSEQSEPEEALEEEYEEEKVSEETEESSTSKEVIEQVEESPPTPADAEPIEPVEGEINTNLIETEDINSPDIIEEQDVVEENQVMEETQPESENTEPNVEEEQNDEKKKQAQSEENRQEQVDNLEPVEEPAPQIDSRAIYTGKKGTGENNSESSTSSGGASLDLSGWIWDFEPEPDDKSDESGKIVFQIIVDNEGEIIGLKTLEKTVSPIVERKYRDAVMDLTFSKTSNNSTVAATSTGKITFIIKSR